MERLGPYELLGKLGEGGMGTVYRARIGGIERAVKVLLGTSWDAHRLARFEREVANLARISHPGVVRIHDAGVIEGRPYFAMDVVKGQSLRDVLGGERLPLDRALEISAQVARGVAALHAEGIVHRDLKPDNVMLTDDGHAIVLDLGLAIAPEKDDRLTQTGALLGTVSYMAPEQVAGKKLVLPQTDVYPLGLILFELVTGSTSVPEASSNLELIGKIMNTPRVRPCEQDPDLPAALDAVFDRATRKDPRARFSDAGAFADAVEALRADPGPSGRSRRRRRRVAAGLLLAGLLGGGIAVAGRGDGSPDGAGEGVAAGASDVDVSPKRLQAAARDRDALATMRDPRERARAATRWLERYRDYPGAEQVEGALAEARLGFAQQVLVHPGDARGVFLAGGRAATIGSDRQVRLWDLTSGRELGRIDLAVVPADIAALQDRQGFVLPIAEKELGLFGVEGKRVRTLPHPWGRPLCLTTSETEVAVGGLSEYVHLINLQTGEKRRSMGMHLASVRGVAHAFDGKGVVSISAVDENNPNPKRSLDNQVRMFDAESGDLKLSIPLTHKPTALAASPVRSLVIVGDRAGNLFDVDLRTREAGEALEGSHDGAVGGVVFTADGQHLFSVGGRPGRTELLEWDVASREVRRRVKLAGGAPCSLDVDPARGRVLVGLSSGRVELWLTPLAR